MIRIPAGTSEERDEFQDRDLVDGAAVVGHRQPYLDDEREQEDLPQHRRREGPSRRITRPLAHRDRQFLSTCPKDMPRITV